MPVPITVPAIANIPLTPVAGVAQPLSGSNAFRSLLGNTVTEVEQARTTAHTSMEKFLSGENEELHQTVMDVQKAELSFDLFLQMRNKVVSAYQEVMRMQL